MAFAAGRLAASKKIPPGSGRAQGIGEVQKPWLIGRERLQRRAYTEARRKGILATGLTS